MKTLTLLFLSLLSLSSLHAQATRTWVSGVGDDANPCSRTAPCKTFAGAISKTAAGGEISVLDPGGFGAVTITKSITIDGNGVVASILSSGVNGIVVNAGVGGVVTLRNLSINGAGTTLGQNGIRVLAAKGVTVEHCQIENYSQNGIDIQPTNSAVVYVSNTQIRNCTAGGIYVKPNGADPALFAVVNLDNVHTDANGGYGVKVEDGGRVSAVRCYSASNATHGFWAKSLVSDTRYAGIYISDSTMSVNYGPAVRSENSHSYINIQRNIITGNVTGLSSVSSGVIRSFGENQVSLNGTDGAPTTTATTK